MQYLRVNIEYCYACRRTDSYYDIFYRTSFNVLAGSSPNTVIGRWSYWQRLIYDYPIEIHNSDTPETASPSHVIHSYFWLEGQKEPFSALTSRKNER